MIELPNQPWFSPKEAAAAIGMSEGFIYDELGRKVLPACKFGRRIRISREDLEEYIREHEHDSAR